jgi:two-component system response regulator MprA
MGAFRVLIVDDDPELRVFLRTELELDGYSCGEAATGQQALTLARQEHWDLLLLDWSLPDFSGVEICQRLRRTDQHTPVLMLTARDDVKERVEALDAGADDYLTKPFSLAELLARMRARLRRGAAADDANSAPKPLQLADLELNPASREVRRAGAEVALTGKEFELLQLLISRPNQVHSRAAILEAIWGENWVGDDNVLDVYVRTLRRKIERPGAATLIHTVRGVGFMLKEGAPRE